LLCRWNAEPREASFAPISAAGFDFDAQKLAQAKRAVEGMLERVRRHNQVAEARPLTAKTGVESPRERNDFSSLAPKRKPVWQASPTFLQWAGASDDRFEVTL